jgi:hypothetical protein
LQTILQIRRQYSPKKSGILSKKEPKNDQSQIEKEKPAKPLQYIILLCGGIILILFAIILKHQTTCDPMWYELLSAIGQALIIGPALSWIIDLKSTIELFKKVTIESLISDEYLGTLSKPQLLDLRKKTTQEIHLQGTSSVEKGLIDLDENVCGLLTELYYERYRQNSSCRIENNQYVKKHNIEELLINPLTSNEGIYREFPRIYLNMDANANVDDFLKIHKLTIKIDDGKEEDYTSQIIIKKELTTEPEFRYNSILSWAFKDNNPLQFSFKKSIQISRVFEVRTSMTDITFIKRVTLPVKSFKIDYNYNGNENIRLIGTCFGTLVYPNVGKMNVIEGDNYISIESFSWMLPGNGIFIVKVPVNNIIPDKNVTETTDIGSKVEVIQKQDSWS